MEQPVEQPSVVPSKEGFVLVNKRRVYARLFSNSLVVSESPTSSQSVLPLSSVVEGESEADTKAWRDALDSVLRFQDDKSAVLLDAMPSHVRASLLPQEDKAVPAAAAAAASGSVRLHLRTLTGQNNTVTVARSGTVRDLKAVAAADVPVDKVNLIFKASILTDNAPLDLPDDSVVFVVVKQQLRPAAAAVAPAPAAPAAKLDEELPAKLLGLAAQMYSLGDYSGSLRAAEKALQVLEGHETPQVVVCLNAIALVEKKMARYARAMELYQRALTLANRRDDNLRILAELNLNIADVNRKLEKYEAAMQQYETAHTMAKKLDGNKKLLIGILVGKGLIEKKNSKFDAAILLYQEALRLETKGTAKWAEIAYNYADVLRKQDKLADAKKLYEEALGVVEATLGPRHAEVAEICNALGMLEKKAGDYAAARNHYERAMSIVSELFGAAHPKIGIYSVNLGDIERKLGDFEKAEVAYNRAIPLLEAALGPDNVELADALNSQGLVLKKKADYDNAEVLYRRALDIVLKTFNKLHYKAGQVMNNLADCYRKRGQYPEALQIYEDAQAALVASLGPAHSETAEVWHNIALVQHQLGRYKEAIELFEKAIAVILKEFGAAHYKMGVFQNNCGLAYAMKGDFPKAYSLLTQALQILRKKLGNDHVEVADSLASLGDVCMKLFVQMNAKDKLAEAKSFYEEANQIVLASFGPSHPKSLGFASLLAICESQAEQALARDKRPIELVQIIMYDVSGSMETKTQLAKHATLDRREISKAFFGAFIDKEIAYQYPHCLGLVTFGDRVTVELPLSRDFESFASLFGQISNLQPATLLLDGVVKSAELIETFCKEHANELAKDYRCRILCLSDGEDSGSKASCATALESLVKANCVFDSIPIEGKHDKMRALSNASGGLCFDVISFEQGLSLFEREAVLSLRHRRPHEVPHAKGRAVEALVDACPYAVRPQICEPPLLATTLARKKPNALHYAFPKDVVKRVMNEQQDLLNNPLPNITVQSQDLSFWVFVWKGQGPYEGVDFVGYCDLTGYPNAPPEVRFHTPIFHCNINNDGRVCLDLLTAATWGPDITLRQILTQLSALLVNPNAFSALDSVKGSMFRENRQLYFDTARQEALKQKKR